MPHDVFTVYRVEGDKRHLNGRYPTLEGAEKAVDTVKRWHGRNHETGEIDPKLLEKVKTEIQHTVERDPEDPKDEPIEATPAAGRGKAASEQTVTSK